jgi:hypothetical protein
VTRVGLSILSMVLVGCGPQWFTMSAAVMPNPVLIGPVARVHPHGPPPAAIHHSLGEEIRVDVWHQDVSSNAYYNSTVTVTQTRTDAGINLGLEILGAAVPKATWHERYQKSDIVYIHSITLETSTLSNRGFGHSDTHESFWLELKLPVLAHFTTANAADTAPVQIGAPVQTAPVQTAPVQTAPVQTAPVQTAPVQTAPVQTAPKQTPGHDPGDRRN